MKTSSIAVETSRSISQSDSIVRQTNKRSFLIIIIIIITIIIIIIYYNFYIINFLQSNLGSRVKYI